MTDTDYYPPRMEEEDGQPQALRFNEDKPELHYILFYPKFLEAFAKVQSQGEIKYGYGNWMYGGKPNREYLDSAMRHLVSHVNEELHDSDTGCLHLAHAAWNIMNLIEQNMKDAETLDPDFDQEGFVERWKHSAKQPKDII